MKKQISYLSVLILSAGLFFSSCKKENKTETDATAEFQTQSDDQAQFTTETDAVSDDANAAIETVGGSYAGERPMNPVVPLDLPCHASLAVDTVSNPRTITINYNGANCSNTRIRTGSVIISFAPGFRWAIAGQQYTVTTQNLKITRLRDNKSITINGEKTVTNVSGGRLRNLATRVNPIVHDITSSGINVTFNDGTQRNWQIAKRRTFTYDNGIVIAVSGTHSAGVVTGIAEWGTNRAGNAFTSAILEPMVVKQSCDFRLVSGKLQHTGPAVTTITTFGLDAAGFPVTSCPSGVFYYKLVWTGPAGTPYTVIRPY